MSPLYLDSEPIFGGGRQMALHDFKFPGLWEQEQPKHRLGKSWPGGGENSQEDSEREGWNSL